MAVFASSTARIAARALWSAAKRFNEQGGWIMSSHVAMSMMLALFPFILFVVALAGVLARDFDPGVLVSTVFNIWPSDVAEPIQRELIKVIKNGSLQLITFGAMLALYFASNGIDAVRVAITRAYRDTDPRPFWKTRALSLIFVIVGGSLLLLGVTVGIGLPAYFYALALTVPEPVATWVENHVLRRAVTIVIVTCAVAACHIWLPGMRHSLRETWPGVALTVALWMLGAWGFSVYTAQFADYSATYAGLAGAMSALIFLYLMGAILIFGAEFNGALMRRSASDKAET